VKPTIDLDTLTLAEMRQFDGKPVVDGVFAFQASRPCHDHPSRCNFPCVFADRLTSAKLARLVRGVDELAASAKISREQSFGSRGREKMHRGQLKRNQQPGSVSQAQALAKRDGIPTCRDCGHTCGRKKAIKESHGRLRCPKCGGMMDRQEN